MEQRGFLNWQLSEISGSTVWIKQACGQFGFQQTGTDLANRSQAECVPAGHIQCLWLQKRQHNWTGTALCSSLECGPGKNSHLHLQHDLSTCLIMDVKSEFLKLMVLMLEFSVDLLFIHTWNHTDKHLFSKQLYRKWNNVQKETSKTTRFNLNLVKNTKTLVFKYILS